MKLKTSLVVCGAPLWLVICTYTHHHSLRCEIKYIHTSLFYEVWNKIVLLSTTLTKLLFVRYAQICSTCMTSQSFQLTQKHVHALTDTHTHTHTHTHTRTVINISLMMMAQTHTLNLPLFCWTAHEATDPILNFLSLSRRGGGGG